MRTLTFYFFFCAACVSVGELGEMAASPPTGEAPPTQHGLNKDGCPKINDVMVLLKVMQELGNGGGGVRVGSHFVGLKKLRRMPTRMLLLIAPQIVSECRLLSTVP